MTDEAPVRVAIAGCGQVALEHHLPALAGLPGLVAVAVAEPDRDRRDAAVERFGLQRGYASVEAMLDDTPAWDLVVVAAPPEVHAEIGSAALERGHGVVIEKPLALDLADADALVRLASTTDRVACCGFNLRCHRLVEEARALVQSGGIGTVRAVRSLFAAAGRTRPDSPAWRRRQRAGGGSLFDLGVHHVDLWRHLLGREAVSVGAMGEDHPLPEETAVLSVRFDGGVLATGVFCQGTAANHSLEIFGDRGRVRLSLYRADGLEIQPVDAIPAGMADRVADLRRTLRESWRHRDASRRGGLYHDSYRRQWAAVAAAVRGQAPPPSTLDDGRQALRVLLAAQRSARSGTFETP